MKYKYKHRKTILIRFTIRESDVNVKVLEHLTAHGYEFALHDMKRIDKNHMYGISSFDTGFRAAAGSSIEETKLMFYNRNYRYDKAEWDRVMNTAREMLKARVESVLK